MQIKVKDLEDLGLRNRLIVEDTARVLGKYFITLDPQKIDLNAMNMLNRWNSVWKIPTMMRSPIFRYDQPLDEAPTVFLEIFLPIIEYNHRYDELLNYQHVEFRYKGRRVAYAISDNGLETMPDDVAARYMAEKMAAMMIDDLKI